MTKKIGLLTYHHVVNDGAVLQALALAQEVKRRFPHEIVEIIDVKSLAIELRELKYVISSNTIDEFVGKAKAFLKFKKFINQNLPLSRRSLLSNNYKKAVAILREYDAVIVGSDEVWKIESNFLSRRFPNIYWLQKDSSYLKFSYAASANKTHVSALPRDIIRVIKEHLSTYELISVRDQHTIDFVRQIDNTREVYKVPDPAFLGQFQNKKIEKSLTTAGIDLSRPILGIILQKSILSKSICQRYRKLGYQIVALSVYNPYADINLVGKLDPLEWASTFQYLTLCISSRFHGVVFSIINHIPFFALDNHNGESKDGKLYDLLNDLGMLENYFHQMSVADDYQALFSKMEATVHNFNKEKISIELEKIRNKGALFLDKIAEKVNIK